MSHSGDVLYAHVARTDTFLSSHNSHSLDLQNVLLLVSVKSDSDCYKALKSHVLADDFTIGPLQLLDKSDIARNMLAQRNKSLNESAFGNQVSY